MEWIVVLLECRVCIQPLLLPQMQTSSKASYQNQIVNKILIFILVLYGSTQFLFCNLYETFLYNLFYKFLSQNLLIPIDNISNIACNQSYNHL